MDVSALDDMYNEIYQCIEKTFQAYKYILDDNYIPISNINKNDMEAFVDFENVSNQIKFRISEYKKIARNKSLVNNMVSYDINFDDFKMIIGKKDLPLGSNSKQLIKLLKSKQKKNVYQNYISSQETDDLIVGESINTYICPITTVRLVKPVRSIKCNHYYSEDAIKQIFIDKQQNQPLNRIKIKCPAFGCDSYIKLKHLTPDKELEYFLSQNQ